MKAIPAAGDPYFSALAPKKAATRADATHFYRDGLLYGIGAALGSVAWGAQMLAWGDPGGEFLAMSGLIVSAVLAGTLALGDRAGRASR